MDNIKISTSDGSISLKELGDISSQNKIFNKTKKRTLKNKLFSKWFGTYKTFAISFTKISKEQFDILNSLFEYSDLGGKILSYRGLLYIVAFTDDTFSYSEEYSYELQDYLYSTTINLEEAIPLYKAVSV